MAHVSDRDLGLKRIIRELNKADRMMVAVGVLEGSKNGEGASIAEYGAYNEFGANIKIAARSQQQYRNINKDGSFRNGGRFSKKSKSNFASWATIDAYEINIPERPFMRTTFDESKAEITADMDQQYARLTTGKATAHQALTIIGQKHADRTKRVITDRDFLPKLADSTIAAKKGSTKTLVDTGALKNAIQISVRQK
jgi:hypothetical protein